MKETSITSTSITKDQKKQYKRFVEDAADEALAEVGPNKDGLQRVIEKGYGLQAVIAAKLRESLVNIDKAVGLDYDHSVYKPKGIAEQIEAIRNFFPGMGTVDKSIASKPLPAGAEGWFAIPRYEQVAANYNEAVWKVFKLIKKNHEHFYDSQGGGLQHGPRHLRQTDDSVQFWKKIGEEQAGYDILIIPAQSGSRHQGRSVSQTRSIMNSSEFGLGVFEVGIMLLTHPERLKGSDDLFIHCPGDKYAPRGDGHFSCAPCFLVDDTRYKHLTGWFDNFTVRERDDSIGDFIVFIVYYNNDASKLYGSASGFVSQ